MIFINFWWKILKKISRKEQITRWARLRQFFFFFFFWSGDVVTVGLRTFSSEFSFLKSRVAPRICGTSIRPLSKSPMTHDVSAGMMYFYTLELAWRVTAHSLADIHSISCLMWTSRVHVITIPLTKVMPFCPSMEITKELISSYSLVGWEENERVRPLLSSGLTWAWAWA